MRPTRLIDPADRLRIEQAVHEAERRTAGELVVVVVAASDEYGAAGWRCGVLLAALAFSGLAAFLPPLPFAAYGVAQAAALAGGHLLARWPALRRRFVSATRMRERVQQRAAAAFAEQGLRHTAGQTGILILVSLFERRVVVLADEGVNRVLDPDEAWEQVVERMLDPLRATRPTEAILAGVERCAEILARHLPAPERPVDELPTALVLVD